MILQQRVLSRLILFYSFPLHYGEFLEVFFCDVRCRILRSCKIESYTCQAIVLLRLLTPTLFAPIFHYRTFTRMYTSVGSTFLWYIAVEDDVVNKRNYAVGPLYLSRLMVVMLAESFWPFLYVFVCYPLASVVGDWTVVIKIGMLLCLNNASYISLGSFLGVLFPNIPQGMIASTLFSQTSLVAAGFYTTLPVYLSWIRYISPVFWTFSGIVKAAYTWSDTYKCIKGSNLAGNNRCFIETSPVIDDMKERGINAAVYGDAQSDNIWLQVCMLILLLFLLQTTIYITVHVRCSRRKKAKEEGIDDSERSAGSAESKQCKMSGW